MTLIKASLFTLLLLGSGLVAAEGGHQQMMAMMKHANPMPNLMMIVVRHGDELDLTEEQSEALAKWRKANHGPMHEKVMEVAKMEEEIGAAALAGSNKAQLMGMTARMLSLRRDIAYTKIDCRDNMQSLLSPEQFSRVLELYQQADS